MKKTGVKVIAFLLFALFVFSCGEKTKKVDVKKLSSIIDASNSFAYRLFENLIQNEKGKNVFISPTSIYTALSMAMNGAKGTTYNEMADILGLKSLTRKQINLLSKALLESLSNLNPEIKLNIANSIWIDNSVKAVKKFIKDSKDNFNSEIRNLKFNASTPGKINSWVADNTDNMIKKLISTLPANAKIVLLNAIFFHGKWKEPFKEHNTRPRVFTMENGVKIKHPIMHQMEEHPYYENSKYQVLRLDYGKERKAGIVLILPKAGKKAAEIYKEIMNDKIKTFPYHTKKGYVYLPKFKISYGVKSIVSPLMSLGMKKAFTPMADFNNMVEAGKLKIADVLHKAVIELNEKGTKASGSTAIVMEKTAARLDVFRFIANRPFLYFITDNRTGLILFMGIMHKPEL